MKRALIVHGGWPGHEPDALAEKVGVYLNEEGFHADKADTLEALDDRDGLAAADLVVMVWSMGELSETREKNLLDAVAAGTGVAGWHGGMGDAFRDSPRFQFMVGGQWAAHPGGKVDYEVRIIDRDHPITQGLSGFSLRSEQYLMHMDPTSRVLATTRMGGQHFPWLNGAEMPVAWIRPWWAGRVFYCSVGHAEADFDVPGVTELIARGVRWAGRDLDPAGGDATIGRSDAAAADADAHW